MAKEYFLVTGGKIQCTVGSLSAVASPNFKASILNKCKAANNIIGVDSDITVGVNIPPTFGVCQLLGPGPCVPVIPPITTWAITSTKCKCNNKNIIKKSSTLQCTVGGSISVYSEGQSKVKGE